MLSAHNNSRIRLLTLFFLILTFFSSKPTLANEVEFENITSEWTERTILMGDFLNLYNGEILIDLDSEYRYKMWFFGWATDPCNSQFTGCDVIFFAKSTDKINWEVFSGKDSNNNPIFDTTMTPNLWKPIFEPRDKFFDSWHNGDPSVVKIENTYYMAYSSVGNDKDGISYDKENDTDGMFFAITGAVSQNGIDWIRSSSPLISFLPEYGKEDEPPILYGTYHRPSLMYEDGRFKLWFDYFGGIKSGKPDISMGYAEIATTPDSQTFLNSPWSLIRYSENPSLNFWPNPEVIHVGENYYSYSDDWDFNIDNNNFEDGWIWWTRKITEATSSDGINWTRTGYIDPESPCAATHIPQAYYENNHLFLTYACQKGGSPYDFHYFQIREMSKQIFAESDLNQDGQVDIFDYNILVTGYGTEYDIFDYNQLVSNYGK